MKSQSKAKLSAAPAPSSLPEEEAPAAPEGGYDRFEFRSGAVYAGHWRVGPSGKKERHGFGKM